MANTDTVIAPSVPERVSRRRTSAQFGFVNFPVNHPVFRSSGEGGMFVKLVVVDDREYEDSDWTICCGAVVTDHIGEELVGDDQLAPPASWVGKDDVPADKLLEHMKAHEATHRAWTERHFPLRYDNTASAEEQCRSRCYMASLVLGNTGWSGFDGDSYWACTVEDLTDQGKALYQSMQKLYPGCTLHLLTFLDT